MWWSPKPTRARIFVGSQRTSPSATYESLEIEMAQEAGDGRVIAIGDLELVPDVRVAEVLRADLGPVGVGRSGASGHYVPFGGRKVR